MKKFIGWLPLLLLLLIPIAILLLHSNGYVIYVLDEAEYPWVVNTEKVEALAKSDSVFNSLKENGYVISPQELINSLKENGYVISPQELTNHTFNYFSWLLTIFVAVVGIAILVFGFDVEKKIKRTLEYNERVLDDKLKEKWLKLMKVDKEVDSTIGGIIDDKIEESLSSISVSISDKQTDIEKRLQKIEENAITFETE